MWYENGRYLRHYRWRRADPTEFDHKKQQAMTSLTLQSTNHGWGVMIQKRAKLCQKAIAVMDRPFLHALLIDDIESPGISLISYAFATNLSH